MSTTLNNTSKRPNLGRRAFLGGLGAGAGLLLTNSKVDILGGSDIDALTYQETLHRLDLSLSRDQRLATVLPWDHPSRQITNTVSIHRGPHIGTLFDGNQIALIHRMYATMLSEQGEQWLKNTTSLEGKFTGSTFKIYSDQPAGALAADFGSSGRTQTMINGGHYMLRAGGVEQSASAFGGPISYGQQLGDHRFRVEGNAFKTHGDAANAFHESLNQQERLQSYESEPPTELITQVLGQRDQYPGVRIGDTSEKAQETAREMLDTIFAGYPEAQQREAYSAIEENGGLDQLHVAFYNEFGFYADGARYTDLTPQQRAERETQYIQVWRIEGPACVIHFKGFPHVHAYINVVRDLSRVPVGDALTRIGAPVGGHQLRQLMQRAMLAETGEAIAHYPEETLGRLSPGLVTTGSVYALDPYQNAIVVVDINADAMADELRRNLIAQGVNVKAGTSYRIATIDYMLEARDKFGEPDQVVHRAASLTPVLIDYLRDKNTELPLNG